MTTIIKMMFASATLFTSIANSCELVPENEISTISSYLMRNLANEARTIRSTTPVKELCYKYSNNKGECVGAIYGYLFYGSLVIDMLWIEKKYRHKGIGKLLISTIESHAKSLGAKFATVTTMDWWQASHFYESLGYSLESTREGYENNSKQYSYIKHFS